MSQQAEQIVKAYFEALSLGQSEQIAGFLSEDFKEIGSLPLPQDKADYLKTLTSSGQSASMASSSIQEIKALGNIVQVDYKQNGNNLTTDGNSRSVYALSDGKIKLEVRVKPTALPFA